MTRVFIGGSRRISHLPAAVCARLDKIVEKSLAVIVGDANGIDKAVQEYLSKKHYENVEVFCSGTTCRNNVRQWRTRLIRTDIQEKTREFYTAKDRAMTDEAVYGFMIWDGKSIGTLLNVLRLLRQGKKVLVYSVLEGRFSELKSSNDWGSFIARYDAAVRNKIEHKMALEQSPATYDQPGLLSIEAQER